jgi:hypothetical protein
MASRSPLNDHCANGRPIGARSSHSARAAAQAKVDEVNVLIQTLAKERELFAMQQKLAAKEMERVQERRRLYKYLCVLNLGTFGYGLQAGDNIFVI